jgi:hypothetical protein
MYTKLTLNIDQNVVEHAKVYAKHRKRSVSKLVEDYLATISTQTQNPSIADTDFNYQTLGPITKELIGIAKKENEQNYKDILTEALLEKYV